MAWCLVAPSHYLNQCWLIMEVLWHCTKHSNLKGNADNIAEIRMEIKAVYQPESNQLTLVKCLSIWAATHTRMLPGCITMVVRINILKMQKCHQMGPIIDSITNTQYISFVHWISWPRRCVHVSLSLIMSLIHVFDTKALIDNFCWGPRALTMWIFKSPQLMLQG